MPDDVKSWLEKLKLGKYAETFAENEIDFRALSRLSEDDLKELGLPLGARRNLQAAVERLPEDLTELISPTQKASTTVSSEAERRQLTVMFCDLVGSTELTQKLDPEDLREVNRAYQETCKSAIDRYEGYVARYMGDGVLAYFGYPQAHEDDAERAIYAGLELVDSVSDLNKTLGDSHQISLGVRVGIATGLVVVGDLIGEGASQENAVVGETPNLAARLQAMSDINSVVIGPRTHELAGGRFEYEDLGALEIKGIAQAVQAWRVVAKSEAESRFEAKHGAGVTPLVGREHEIGLLLERWEHTQDGDGQVVLLCGDPGIGKSRISEIIREHSNADNSIRLRYQCSAYHSNSALHPVIEQLERAAHIKSEDSTENKLEKLESLISQATENIGSTAPLLARLLSISIGDRYAPLEMSPEQQKEATLKSLVSQMEGLSEKSPVLLVFEDVHWADPTSIELLELIISRIQNLRVLVVITFRPEFSPPWSSHSYITSLTLSRLSRNQVITMIERVAGGKTLPDEVRDQIIEKTDGVPLFVEELTKTIIESDVVEDQGNYYRLTGSLQSFSIPSTLHDSLMARLDRSASVREVAQIAAVIGKEFSHNLLSGVTGLTPKELEDAINQLMDAALIFRHGSPPNAQYSFKHALVQNAAYESLLRSKRKHLHAQIAQTLENDFPEKVEHEPELLAYHYTEADVIESAIDYWLKAGKRAIQQCAHAEAIAHLRRGLAMVESLPEVETKTLSEITFRVTLGIPLIGQDGADSHSVVENYLRARTLCEQTGKTEQLYPILWGLWFHNFFSSELRHACELADELLEVGENRNDTELLLEAHHCQWATRFVGGEFSNALEHCEQGVQLYQAKLHHALTFTYGGHDPGVCARNVSGIALWLLGYQEQSRERFDSAFRLARELSHSATLADALQMVVEVSSLQRDEEKLEEQARELLEFAEAERMFDNQTLANGLIGWVTFRRGNSKKGLSLMRESLPQWLGKGIAWTAVPISLVAETLGQIGEAKEGLRLVDETLRLGQRDQVHWWEAELYRVRGELLQKCTPDGPSKAEDSFKRAIEIARTQSAKSLELRAAVNLAHMWMTRGKNDQARELLTPIYGWFTEGLDFVDLKNAKGLLKELA